VVTPDRARPLTGIACKLCSVTFFITMASLIKATSGHVPPGEAVFFRSFFAIPVILIWLALRGDLRTGLRVRSPLNHFWRGFVGTAAMGLGFAALGLLPLPEVTALGYAAPLLVVIFAAMFLNEQVGVFRLGAVGLGLVGVLIVLAPRLTALSGPTVETMMPYWKAGVQIHSRVIDAANGEPIRGAFVVVFEAGVRVSQLTADNLEAHALTYGQTNNRGAFELEHPVPRGAAYTVAVVAEGYAPLVEEDVLEVDAETPNRHDPWGNISLERR